MGSESPTGLPWMLSAFTGKPLPRPVVESDVLAYEALGELRFVGDQLLGLREDLRVLGAALDVELPELAAKLVEADTEPAEAVEVPPDGTEAELHAGEPEPATESTFIGGGYSEADLQAKDRESLRELARGHGLPVSGNKGELIARLLDHYGGG